jgi:hypothetical protein
VIKNIHLDFWIKNNYNVLFTGKHGVGKSSIVISAFNRAKLNWKYFSAATMDPWVDFVGVPKEKIDENGNSYLDLIRPKEFQGDEIEAIFFDEFNRCLTGDTQIQLVDGYSVSIKDLVDKKEFFVYSYDIKNNQVQIGKGHSARLTGKKQPIIKIILDNGNIIRCTKDHPFLLSNGSYIKAEQLKKYDILMALYKKYNYLGYEKVTATKVKYSTWKYTHILADEFNIKHNIYEKGDNEFHRHHKDCNKFNNVPNNIIRLNKIAHLKLHNNSNAHRELCSKGGRTAHINHPDLYKFTIGNAISRKKAIKNSINSRKTKEYRIKRSKISKEIYSDEMRLYRSQVTKQQWNNGQFDNINRLESNRKSRIAYTIKILKRELGDLTLTKDAYEIIWKRVRNSGCGKGIFLPKTIEKLFGNFENFYNHYYSVINKDVLNHKVISIEDAGFEDVYDITIDDYNNFAIGPGIFVHNSHKKVRNSVLELLQFKSINGKKFNKLKIIWAAINPAGEDEEYDTEQLDPAQEDRFHIKVDIPYSPDLKYFSDRYGAQNAKAAIEWWKDLPKEIQKDVSPRRLDYALDVYYNKGDLNYVLPKGTNVGKLLQGLTNGPILETLQKVLKDNNIEEARKFINIENNYMASLNYILKNKQIFNYYFPLLEKEKISSILASSFKDNKPIIKEIIKNSIENKDIQEVIQSIIEAKTNKILDKYLIKTIKEMGLKDKFIVSSNVENTYTRMKILYDCRIVISNLHKNPNATEKEFEDVLNKIEPVLKRTQYYTIKHRSFIKSMISQCLPHLSYGKNYIKFIEKFPEIYGKCGFKF